MKRGNTITLIALYAMLIGAGYGLLHYSGPPLTPAQIMDLAGTPDDSPRAGHALVIINVSIPHLNFDELYGIAAMLNPEDTHTAASDLHRRTSEWTLSAMANILAGRRDSLDILKKMSASHPRLLDMLAQVASREANTLTAEARRTYNVFKKVRLHVQAMSLNILATGCAVISLENTFAHFDETIKSVERLEKTLESVEHKLDELEPAR